MTILIGALLGTLTLGFGLLGLKTGRTIAKRPVTRARRPTTFAFTVTFQILIGLTMLILTAMQM